MDSSAQSAFYKENRIKMDDLRKLRLDLKSLLITSKKAMTITDLVRDYKKECGPGVPLCGYRNLRDLLRSLPDILKLQEINGETFVFPVSSENTKHIEEPVSRQKLPKSNGRKPECNTYESDPKSHSVEQGSKEKLSKNPVQCGHQNTSNSMQEQKNFERNFRDNLKIKRNEKKENLKTGSDLSSRESGLHEEKNATRFKQNQQETIKSVRGNDNIESNHDSKQVNHEKIEESLKRFFLNSNKSNKEPKKQGRLVPSSSKINEDSDNQKMLSLEANANTTNSTSSNSGRPSASQDSKKMDCINHSNKESEEDIRKHIVEIIKHSPSAILLSEFAAIYETKYKQHFNINKQLYLLMEYGGIQRIPGKRGSIFVPSSDLIPTEYLSEGELNELDVLTVDDDLYMQSLVVPKESEGRYIHICLGERWNPHMFFIYFRNFKPDLEKLANDMTMFYKNCPAEYKLDQDTTLVHLHCALEYQYGKNKKVWFRGRVVEKCPNGRVIVCCLDFGTFLTVDYTKLYYLHKHFAILPTQAVIARLSNVEPLESNGWSPECIEMFSSLTNSKQYCSYVSYVGNQLHISLIDSSTDEDVCVGEKLYRRGMVRKSTRNRGQLSLNQLLETESLQPSALKQFYWHLLD